jgi:hypothetical protein
VTITPEAIANDPALANMQSWDLLSTTTGNWQTAGLKAALPAGSFFYRHPLGGFKKPSPKAIAGNPALAFTPYVNTPNDDGLNNANTLILGGFEEPLPSIGDVTALLPGVFSVSWGDLVVDPPGTYQIARLTFPQGMLPNIEGNSPRPATSQVNPDGSTFIPNIPEPAGMSLLMGSVLWIMRWRPAVHHFPHTRCEQLEARRLLSFSPSFLPNAGLTPGTDTNASNTNSPMNPITEGEAVVSVSPSDPLNVATYAVSVDVSALDFNSRTLWYSSDGGVMYMPRTVPTPQGQTSGGDPAVTFDRAGNLYVAQLSNPGSNVSIAKSTDGGQSWTTTLIDNSSGADKPWILSAPHPTQPDQDSVYVMWGGRLFRSDDGAMNFSAIPAPVGGDSLRMVASHDGRRLFAGWWNRAVDIRFNWGEYDQFNQLVWHADHDIDTAPGNIISIPASPGAGILAAPSVAVDTTGRAFVTYTKKPDPGGATDTDVWVARNDDPTSSDDWTLTRLRDNTNSQFHSFVSTDPMTGVPYVSWPDTVNDPNNENVQPFMTVSLDGGVTWEPPTLVSDGDEVSRPYSPFSYGHYNGNSAFAGMGYDVWPSNAHSPTGGPLDIYTDRVILSGHVITVTGTAGSDVYHVRMDQSETFVQVWENTDPVGLPDFIMHKDALDGLIFDLGDGVDVIFVAPEVLDYLALPDKFLDLGDNRIIVDYFGSSPGATVRALLTSGYNNGAWTGSGIRSSAAAADDDTGIGYAETADLFSTFPATFSGHAVDDTAVLLRHTGYGDTDLNGNVNLADFDRLADNFGMTFGASWFQGDFDFNGNVNLADFDRLANNFGMTFSDDAEDPGDGFVQYTYEDLLEMLLGG